MKHLVTQNFGCALLPLAAVAEEEATGALKSFRLVPEVRRSVGLTLGRNRPAPAGLTEAVRLTKAVVKNLVLTGAWPDAMLKARPKGTA
jgi:hypothetical protein